MADDGDQLFSLAWNNFRAATSSAFTQLWSKGDFSDVTLVTEDEQLFRTHKFVLRAASRFLDALASLEPTQVSRSLAQ